MSSDDETVAALRERAHTTIVGQDMGLRRLAAQFRDGAYGDLQLFTVFKILLHRDFNSVFTFGLGWIRLDAVDWMAALQKSHNIQEFHDNIQASEVERLARFRQEHPRRSVDEDWGYVIAPDPSISSHILLLNTGGHITEARGHFLVVTFEGGVGQLIQTSADGNCFTILSV